METDEYIRTRRLAQQVDVQPASIRTALYRTGHYCGITPRKAANGQLLWPGNSAKRIAGGK